MLSITSGVNAHRNSAVPMSAGKNDSMDSSEAVISIAVPKVVIVLRKQSWCGPDRSRSGTAIPLSTGSAPSYPLPWSSRPARRSLSGAG